MLVGWGFFFDDIKMHSGAGKTSILMALLGEMHFMPYDRRTQTHTRSVSASSSRTGTPAGGLSPLNLSLPSESDDTTGTNTNVDTETEDDEGAAGAAWFNLPREGGVAYAAQESWVQNETIRDNIVFGGEFDEGRYTEGEFFFFFGSQRVGN